MEEHLLLHCKENILEILQDENIEKHFPVNINFIELFENDTSLGNKLLKDPDNALDELDNWVLHVQDLLLREFREKNKLSFKHNVHARVYGLPACPELYRTIFPRNEDLETFLQITGTVVKTKDPKMLEYQGPYRCTKCKNTQMIQADYNQKYVIIPPKKCLNPEGCQGRNLTNVGTLTAENCKDYQEIKIQEQASNLNSTMPSSLWATLEDDLVDLCKPGDDVTTCGIVKRRWSSLVVGKEVDVELAFKVDHIQVHNGNTTSTIITSETREQFATFWKKFETSPLEGRDMILKSFCPKLYGMYLVKLAMAIVLAGGSSKYGSESSIQKRSESHILLVGDPGTGKSQLLRYSSKIIPRSVLTTGVGTTSAGLTVAAVMEEGQWQLEAGALVLADGGICCIDEFNSMKPNDRASIHEAMEQQTISVAKAGILCKLRTRCSIVAATNPKGGHLDPSQTLSLNLAIPSPLLSRFDVVLMLKDTYNHEWDSKISKHIVSGKSLNANKVDGSLWSLETLQQYFTVVKTTNPLLSTKADLILAAYYQAQRRASSRNKSRTTVRLLESLIRLSQGHAKLMCHHEVHVMDAIFAIIISESSMHGECAVLSLNSLNVLESFPNNPMKSYANLSSIVLTKLGLNEVLDSEIDFLKNKCSVDVTDQENEELVNISEIFDTSRRIYSSTQCETTKELTDDKNEVDDNRAIKEQTTCDNDSEIFNNVGNNNFSGKITDGAFVKAVNNSIMNNSSSSRSNPFNLNCLINKDTINKILSNSSVEEDKNFENVIGGPKSINRKRKNCVNARNFNTLNLIKSVNDDFDKDNTVVENTKRRNFRKKLKPNECTATTSEDNLEKTYTNIEDKNKSKNQIKKSEITATKESPNKYVFNFNSDEMSDYQFDDLSKQKPSTSIIKTPNTKNQKSIENKPNTVERTSPKQYNFDFNESANYYVEDVFNCVPKTENLSKAETKTIESSKKAIAEKSSDVKKTSVKSKFGFIPKNPPPEIISKQPLESEVKNQNTFLGMFDSEDENLDFLDIDI